MYGIPFTAGWMCLAFANSVALLIVGRVIVGFSAGLLSGTAPSYVVEIAPVSIRGFLGACFQLCVTIGILSVYVFGAFLNWKILAGISSIPPLLMAIFMLGMPETPSWLLSKNRRTEALSSLQELRSADSDCNKEIQVMEQNKSPDNEGFTWAVYKLRENYMPLILALALMLFQQFSGINAVMFYSTDIFTESGSSIEPKFATIIIGAAQVFATAVGSLLVDRLGRKMLLTISGCLHVISLCALGAYYWANENSESNSFGWVPVVSLVVFIVGFSTGFGPIPWLMIAEITPIQSRSVTSAIATGFNWTCAFVITKTFEPLKEAISKQGVYFLFGLFSLISIFFVIFALPETKGKTNEEIEQFFKSDPSNNIKNGSNNDKVELEKLNG